MPAALEEKAPETTGAALAAKKAVPAEKEAPLAEKEALLSRWKCSTTAFSRKPRESATV